MQLYRSGYSQSTSALLKRSRMQSTLARQSPLVWHLLSWLEPFVPHRDAGARLLETEAGSHGTADPYDAWRLFAFADLYMTHAAPAAADLIGSADAVAFAQALRERSAEHAADNSSLPARARLHAIAVQMWDVDHCYGATNKSRDRGDFNDANQAEREYEDALRHEITLRRNLQAMLNHLPRFHRASASPAYHRHACRADWYSEVPQFEPSYKWPPLGRLITWPLTNLRNRGDHAGLARAWDALLDSVREVLEIPAGACVPEYSDPPRPPYRGAQPARAISPASSGVVEDDIPF